MWCGRRDNSAVLRDDMQSRARQLRLVHCASVLLMLNKRPVIAVTGRMLSIYAEEIHEILYFKTKKILIL